MEFPFGHHSHTHHHTHQRNEDDDRNYPERPQFYPPPPPFMTENEFAPPRPHFRPPGPPPPPQVYHSSHNQEPDFDYPPPPPRTHYPESNVYHSSHNQDTGSDYPPPPPRPHYPETEYPPQTHVYHSSHNQEPDSYYPPPPPPSSAQVTHVSHQRHDLDPDAETETHHSFKSHLPSFLQHHSHHSDSASGLDFTNKPTYKVFCKARPDYYLTIRDGKVVLAPSDPADQFQNWYKDEKYSTKVKDEDGFPSFALVNKACGLAMKHSIGDTHPVQLIQYKPDVLDESVLWSESQDLGDGYRSVRMINNVRLHLDAFHGDKKSGGIHNGTTIVLWKWNKGDNQRWKITPY